MEISPLLIGFDEIPLRERDLMTEIKAFGDALITTGDLDPVYVAIYGAGLPEPQLCRLLIAYGLFYHLGAAAWLSEHSDASFWHWVRIAAVNEEPVPHLNTRWPRSAERRHFRGPRCVGAVNAFAQQAPEAWVRRLAPLTTDIEIIREVQFWPLCGPWVAYKFADLMSTCYGSPVTFTDDVVLFYREPRAALGMLDADYPRRPYLALREYFSARTAPPRHDRQCGPAECETVACKFKSMLGGHYHIGKDIHEVAHGLAGWGETADCLAAALERGTA